MGRGGTEVAKNAADMVLTDDNFATIVSAVREGRTVYRNIRKTIHFFDVLQRRRDPRGAHGVSDARAHAASARAASVGEPRHRFLPALALGSDPPQEDVMQSPPNPQESTVFSNGLGLTMAVEGMMIGALALLAFSAGRALYDTDPMSPVIGRTMAFAVLSLSQLVHSFNMRSAKPVVGHGMLKNRWLNLSFLICAALMAGVIVLPPAAALFGTAALDAAAVGHRRGAFAHAASPVRN